ncbi:MAG: alpha-mannosidase [Armatimonadetes bacterium]|nr:alpha-mannosidase [Armatimonadota bacterium]
MTSLLDVLYVRLEEIKSRIIAREETLNGWQTRHAKHLAPEQYEYIDDWQTVNVGDIWARQGQNAFMRKDITIPSEWVGACVGLQFMTGGEGLLRIDGKAFHGVDDNRIYILLNPSATGGETYSCEIEIKTGNYFKYVVTNPSMPYILSVAKLIAVDKQVESAYSDFKTTWDAARALKDPVLKEAILLAMKDALTEVDFRDKTSSNFGSSITSARKTLRANLDAIEFGDSSGTCFCVGHSHIDVAWLWPLKETARKVGRTYSTVTALMDEYPDYHFVCSQVPLFLYTKQYFPEVYDRVKQRVAEGRFEPIGGTWVENDCNVVSGESLVRQCLYGKRFFQSEFGVDVRVGWLPDVFGYSWAMPQIYKKSGLDYFMTAKISWNDTNRFPHNTFTWQGIDGTRMLTHFIHGTYNAMLQADELAGLWDGYNSKLSSPEFLSAFGWGDGGGGPSREMLERMSSIADIPGMPKVKTGRAHDFFDKLASEVKDLPVWNGEFYFELHRGTYTTQAGNKRNNRKSELTYREAEIWNSIAALYGHDYPNAALTEGWQGILLNQFHDIIPGSSINDVYQDSNKHYAEILSSGESMITSAAKDLTGRIDTRGDGEPIVVFNSLSWDRVDVVSMDLKNRGGVKVIDSRQNEVPSQLADGKLTFVASDVPSCGYGVYRVVDGDSELECPFRVDGQSISTPYYDLTLASDGTVRRLYDKTNLREVLPNDSRANVLQVFEDKPSQWEAWDIELQYQDKMWEFASERAPEVLECGPVRLVLGLSLSYGKSKIDQKIVFYAHTPRIDFVNNVDWQDRQMLLKVAFPVDIHSTRATYEMAFGAVDRPTHWNTSWDKAMFEVCGHKWADLSETGYGVSVLNDCKYGWDIKDNVMRLTLLRAPDYPDPEADRGAHEFTYSLLPHAGDWTNGAVRAGYELNCPLLRVAETCHDGKLDARHSFVAVDRDNVVIDTVKQAEDSDHLVVRAYEAHGSRGPACLTFDRQIVSIMECNLLEEDTDPVDFDGKTACFAIKPFEIRTFKIKLAGG